MPSRQVRQFLTFVIVFLALFGYLRYARHSRFESPFSRYVAPPLVSGAEPGPQSAEDHYSPAENLEQIDLARLREAQHSLDIAMYAFTDKYLADAIVERARAGVKVRIYRDRSQYDQEQDRSNDKRESTTEQFRNEANIQIRVKHSKELMHLKAYLVDGRILRTGSANWSPSGLKRQDNNAHFCTDPAQIKIYQGVFEDMWNRSDNEVVQ